MDTENGPALRAPGIYPPDAPGALTGSAPGAPGSAPGALRYTDHEWRERFEAAVAKTVRSRQAKAAERRELDARRQVGKAIYHRQKLARAKARGARGTQRGRGSEEQP